MPTPDGSLLTGSVNEMYAPNLHVRSPLVCFLALFSCEAFARMLVVAGHPHRSRAPEFAGKLLLAKAPVEKEQPLLFVGGSFIQNAVFPDLFRERLRERGFEVYPKNLGCRGSCIQEHITLLNAAVPAGAKPALVFL